MNPDLVIESWTTMNPRWNDVVTLAHLLDQADWLLLHESWHRNLWRLRQRKGYLASIRREDGRSR